MRRLEVASSKNKCLQIIQASNSQAEIMTEISSDKIPSRSSEPWWIASNSGSKNKCSYVVQRLKDLPKLHKAVWKDDLQRVKTVLTGLKKTMYIDYFDKEHRTALHFACARGHDGMVRAICQAGANPNIADGQGKTPLHIAVESGNYSSVQYLLYARADTDVIDSLGRTPLHIAAKIGDVSSTQLLLQREARTDISEKDGLTALHVATLNSNHAIVDLLTQNNGKLSREEKEFKEAAASSGRIMAIDKEDHKLKTPFPLASDGSVCCPETRSPESSTSRSPSSNSSDMELIFDTDDDCTLMSCYPSDFDSSSSSTLEYNTPYSSSSEASCSEEQSCNQTSSESEESLVSQTNSDNEDWDTESVLSVKPSVRHRTITNEVRDAVGPDNTVLSSVRHSQTNCTVQEAIKQDKTSKENYPQIICTAKEALQEDIVSEPVSSQSRGHTTLNAWETGMIDDIELEDEDYEVSDTVLSVVRDVLTEDSEPENVSESRETIISSSKLTDIIECEADNCVRDESDVAVVAEAEDKPVAPKAIVETENGEKIELSEEALLLTRQLKLLHSFNTMVSDTVDVMDKHTIPTVKSRCPIYTYNQQLMFKFNELAIYFLNDPKRQPIGEHLLGLGGKMAVLAWVEPSLLVQADPINPGWFKAIDSSSPPLMQIIGLGVLRWIAFEDNRVFLVSPDLSPTSPLLPKVNTLVLGTPDYHSLFQDRPPNKEQDSSVRASERNNPQNQKQIMSTCTTAAQTAPPPQQTTYTLPHRIHKHIISNYTPPLPPQQTRPTPFTAPLHSPHYQTLQPHQSLQQSRANQMLGQFSNPLPYNYLQLPEQGGYLPPQLQGHGQLLISHHQPATGHLGNATTFHYRKHNLKQQQQHKSHGVNLNQFVHQFQQKQKQSPQQVPPRFKT